ncbi:hypothetical protein [Brevibacillus laterosporus]|uniref:hypothetical protein n=1 Tax=Brevibacillus laterosporus TaxID=1465 RepID=UPI0018CFE6A1|nr:hypothetical protein [Brevibacillus laterosporus]MBG9790224.1 hypothetical protein [Brevibacillus laterosporus]
MNLAIPTHHPVMYNKRKEFLDCLEYLICSYIQGFGVPYHWLLSDRWGFYYRSIDDFTAAKEEVLIPFPGTLQKIYKAEFLHYEKRELLDVVKETISQNRQLFTVVDGRFFPWYTDMEIFSHFVLIQDYDSASKLFYITDLWPYEFSDWFPIEPTKQAYEVEGRYSFTLTEPSLQINEELLQQQFRSVCDKITGTDPGYEGYLSGQKALLACQQDMILHGKDLGIHLDKIFDMLKRVINYRDGFLEFVLYADQDQTSPVRNEIDPALITLVEETVNIWAVFRNYLIKAKVTGSTTFQKQIDWVDKIIEKEKEVYEKLTTYF